MLLGLFRGYGLQYLYSEDLAALQLMLRVLDELIEIHLPRLHKHFQEQVKTFGGRYMECAWVSYTRALSKKSFLRAAERLVMCR